MTDLTWRPDSPDAAAEIRPLLLAVAAADGRPEVTGGAPLPREFRGGEHLLATDGIELVGYAHLDTDGDSFGRQVAEVLVRPDARRRGVGSALVDAVIARAADGTRFWAHGDHPGAARIAERQGLSRVRELLTMRIDLAETDLPDPVWREGVRVRTFETGRDEAAVVEVNKKAFDWHPEQGALTVADVEATEAEAWFDPAGFFLAVDPDDQVLGFHWTKVHPGGVGEVYVVGVDPGAQGGGLGKALTLAGLAHLRSLGLTEVILYVESDNAPAVAVYSRLGFTRSAADVQYARAEAPSV
ncbi:mycothiol synthase [Actinokineospora globicatena]|uniref:mycothiol synthase n=1 Tax=Actinokineospora globicatena TaxID=103729 RepID=UPI0020A3D691|nr:mycothiol synthase [Actinokineospora globicatena]MCP2301524.1 mycothiol synthase [Actinokineospora globicatena]GLW76829.1 mycothiol acetyltransferase [Actinokineospora globicatena]GLW83662.1 mycothiol acetyltransferase [Actinokineospora globicatena]